MDDIEFHRAAEQLIDIDSVLRVLVRWSDGRTDEARPVHTSYDISNNFRGRITLQRTVSISGRSDLIPLGPPDKIARITIDLLDGTRATFPPEPDAV